MTEVAINKSSEKKEKIVKTVGVVVFDGKGNVLVVRHGDRARVREGIYGLPAGHQNEAETARQAAARELKEEAGIEVLETSLREFPGNYFEGKIELKDRTEKANYTVFLAPNFNGEIFGEEGKTKPEWISVKDLNLLYPTLPNVSEVVQNAGKFLNEQS